MSDVWIPTLKMNLTRDEFDTLRRHPSYKYELVEGGTWILPWPRPSTALYAGTLQAHPSVATHKLADIASIAATPLTSMPLEFIDTAG